MTEITIIGDGSNQEPKDYSKGYLSIPFEGDQFKDFITSLLGKPQNITKNNVGLFEIHLKDLQNFFDLINQRIIQQNNGQLIQFTTNIFFNDRSSVQLGSYEELVSYNEVKPIISRAVRMSWSYLIQFSDKKHLEKQTIEIFYTTGAMLLDNEDQSHFVVSSSRRGLFVTRIEHTARSWGFDLENVISNQIESLMLKENVYKKFVCDNETKISIISSFIFFFISVVGALVLTNSFINRELSTIKSFTNVKNQNINEKFNFLISYIVSGVQPRFYFQIMLYLVVTTIISLFLGIWISAIADDVKENSFLVLTRKAKENRDEVLKRAKNSWYVLLFSLVGSIIVGVVSNYIFKILIE